MVLIDGQSARAEFAHDRGLAYGDGIFETVALRHGRLLCWDAHFARLRHGCEALGFAPPAHAVLTEECGRLTHQSRHGVIKIIVTRGSGGRGYRIPAVAQPRRIVALHPWPDDIDPDNRTGVKTWICTHRLSPNTATAGLKHLNRLDQVLASREWPGADFFEGLMLDPEGRLIEGTRSNLFVVKRGIVHTPDLGRCGVNGIIRDAVLAACRREGIPVTVEPLATAALTMVDEVFICNSIIGIRPVTRVGCGAGITFRPGPVSSAMTQLLRGDGTIP